MKHGDIPHFKRVLATVNVVNVHVNVTNHPPPSSEKQRYAASLWLTTHDDTSRITNTLNLEIFTKTAVGNAVGPGGMYFWYPQRYREKWG